MSKVLQNLSVFLFLIIISVSCSKNTTVKDDLELALQLSKNNRNELEKVLTHYRQNTADSLKLKAAEFLIRNMISHYSVTGELMDYFKRDIDSTLHDKPAAIKLAYYLIATRKVVESADYGVEYDLHTIKSDYLIKNIEQSFQIWQNYSDYYNLNFEEFCEYILPYRVDNEPLTLWKDSALYNTYNFEMGKNLNFDLSGFSSYISAKIPTFETFNPAKLSDTILNKHKRDREDMCYSDKIIKTIFGIPTAIDFITYSNKENSYFWSVILDRRYPQSVFSSSNNNPYAAKVYRKTFSLNPIPSDDKNFVPKFFKNPYSKDVTECYQKVSPVEYDFRNLPEGCHYAYLSVFNNLLWQEISWSKINDGVAVFEKMGQDIIYMPSYYEGDKQRLGEYPLWLKSTGEVVPLIPHKDKLQKLKLRRKFTYDLAGDYSGNSIIGIQIYASNDLNCKEYDSIATIQSYRYMAYDTLSINCKRKYKYWMLKKANSGTPELASVKFVHAEKNLRSDNTFVIGRDDFIEKNKDDSNFIFNDNLSDFCPVHHIVGVEFKEPVSVDKIMYMTRNDNNGVYPGQVYELLYFDNGKWVSMGCKQAVDYYIEYDNVPTNALYWLRNLTKKNNDERPFTVDDNRIRFW